MVQNMTRLAAMWKDQTPKERAVYDEVRPEAACTKVDSYNG